MASAAAEETPTARLASDIVLGPAKISIRGVVLSDHGHTPLTNVFFKSVNALSESSDDEDSSSDDVGDAGLYTHPRMDLERPPPGIPVSQWKTHGIFAEHPMMCMLLPAEANVTILGFEWNEVMAALGITGRGPKGTTSKMFVKRVNKACGRRYPWLPQVTADMVLPIVSHTDTETGPVVRRCLPTFLVPFLRYFLDNAQAHHFDTQIAALSGHMMMTLRVDPSYAALLNDIHSQFSVNTATVSNDNARSLWDELDELKKTMETLKRDMQTGSDPAPHAEVVSVDNPVADLDDLPLPLDEESLFMKIIKKRDAARSKKRRAAKRSRKV